MHKTNSVLYPLREKNYVGTLSSAQDGISTQYWPQGSSTVSDLHLQRTD